MITGRQIRAARALLGWDAATLAGKAGLTRETVSNIENSLTQAREATLSVIAKILTEERIELLDNEGVRFRAEDVEVLTGSSGLRRFFDKVFAYAQIANGLVTIMHNGIEENQFEESAPDVTSFHRARMSKLIQTQKNVFVRAILQSGDQNFVSTDYADYRWHPASVPPPVPYYIFGDSLGIFAFKSDPSPKIILITSVAIAQAFTQQFMKTWDVSVPIMSNAADDGQG